MNCAAGAVAARRWAAETKSSSSTAPIATASTPTIRNVVQLNTAKGNGWWGWAVAALVGICLIVAFNSGGNTTAGSSSRSGYSGTSYRSNNGDTTVYGKPSVAENGNYYGEPNVNGVLKDGACERLYKKRRYVCSRSLSQPALFQPALASVTPPLMLYIENCY